MTWPSLYSYSAAALVVLATAFLLRPRKVAKAAATIPYPLASVPPEQLPQHIQSLLAELPDSVVLQSDVAAFQEAVDYSWTQQHREIIPACVVRPRNARQLATAVVLLKREHDKRSQTGNPSAGFFTVRSGGANSGIWAATLQDSVVIDLSLFSDVTPGDDGATVTIGTGAKWLDVYKTLNEKDITVIGGRSSPVGVGGLTLQGTVSLGSWSLRPSMCHMTRADHAYLTRRHVILLCQIWLRLLQCRELRGRTR